MAGSCADHAAGRRRLVQHRTGSITAAGIGEPAELAQAGDLSIRAELPEAKQADLTSDGYAWPKTETFTVLKGIAQKPYEDWQCITDSGSVQWRMLHSSGTRITADGLITIDGWYAAALGSRFGPVGTRYIFLLERADGSISAVRVIKADAKKDCDTVDGWTGANGHIMEMIVETEALPEEVRISGDCNDISVMDGRVIRISKVED